MTQKIYKPDNYYYFATKFLILAILIWKIYVSMQGFWAAFYISFFMMMIAGIPFAMQRQSVVIDREKGTVQGSFGRRIYCLPLSGIDIADCKLWIKRWTMLSAESGKIFIPHELFKFKTLESMLNDLRYGSCLRPD